MSADTDLAGVRPRRAQPARAGAVDAGRRAALDRPGPADARGGRRLGIPAIALFPVTPAELKTADGAEAINPDNLICRAVRAIKAAVPDLGVVCDVALDPYTSHGQDGLIDDDGYVLNDETLAVLAKQALVQAEAGCDVIAPSDMMDGRIGAIRETLDEAGLQHTRIMSYAAKYASALLRPVPRRGRLVRRARQARQGDLPARPGQRRRGAARGRHGPRRGRRHGDGQAGMPYLDVVRRVKDAFGVRPSPIRSAASTR